MTNISQSSAAKIRCILNVEEVMQFRQDVQGKKIKITFNNDFS